MGCIQMYSPFIKYISDDIISKNLIQRFSRLLFPTQSLFFKPKYIS